ncbi:Cathepsin S [Papilio machaon]|uniref:Cathepsin S n=1 Tax=Papilio machaon TaxID=76193 RepID=A0A0N1IIE6_PAPMA|nr:Cathepsin S [Papilio machaon]
MSTHTVFNKSYGSHHHETIAKTTWLQNLQFVAKHNRDYLSGKKSYSLQLNHFGDWHVNDYISEILKLISTVPLLDPARDYGRMAYRQFRHHKVPRSLDWRNMGFKPRREEQWHCGACYAFAVAHAMQAQLYKKHKRWDELSPQQIVDCSYEDGNQGCNGGSLQAAFRYAAREGLAREKQYPYRGKKGHCHHRWGTARVRPRRWAVLPAHDEVAMERALANIGPLAVAVNAAPITFQLYRSGIYDDPFCVPWRMNHAMLLVGYTPHYWLLLNWWGHRWGEDGYIRQVIHVT